jgi:hypothetical protein
VDTVLAIAVAGAVLAAFVPTFLRSIRTSKIAEAPENLEALYLRSAAYFAARHDTAQGPARSCLPEAAGPTPAEPSADAADVDFHAEDTPGHATWRALDWRPSGPVRFRYTFLPVANECRIPPGAAVVLTLRAEGDLDGDGTLSCFERDARVKDAWTLEPTGALYVRDRVE